MRGGEFTTHGSEGIPSILYQTVSRRLNVDPEGARPGATKQHGGFLQNPCSLHSRCAVHENPDQQSVQSGACHAATALSVDQPEQQ